MHCMQYEITPPVDYGMDIIRRRLATKGDVMDGFPGLGVMVYAIRELGVDESPVNQYARSTCGVAWHERLPVGPDFMTSIVISGARTSGAGPAPRSNLPAYAATPRAAATRA
jgi:hypothetical protein